jgi:prevent-host-death family protein
MRKDLPMTEARTVLASLPRKLTRDPGAVAVTRRGRPVLAIMPWDLYESIVETLAILGDEKMAAALRQSIREAESGDTVPLEKARARLGL